MGMSAPKLLLIALLACAALDAGATGTRMVIIDQDGRIVERITGDAKEGRIEGLVAPLLVK